MAEGPATRFAKRAGEWEPNDWWRLEARARERQRPVRQALAYFSPAEVWKDLARNAEEVSTDGGCLGTAGHIGALSLPVVAMFGMFGWIARPDRNAPVLMIGLVLLLAVLLVSRGLVHDIRQREFVEGGSARLVGLLHLVPSTITLVIALSALAAGKVDAPIGIALIVLDVAVGVLHLVMFRKPGDDNEARWTRNLTRLKGALEAVPAEERIRVTADLTAAFDELERSGRVPAAEITRSRSRSLGMLGMGLAPRPDLAPTPRGEARP